MGEQRHLASTLRVAIASAVAAAGVFVAIGAQPASAAQTYIVDTTSADLDADVGNPDGETSLADAAYLANTDVDTSTITFDISPEAIIDTVNVPPISEDLTITGPGRAALTLTNSAGDVLSVDSGASLELSALAIDSAEGGGAAADGIFLDGFGDVLVTAVDIANVVVGIQATQPGPDASGSLTVSDSTVATASETGIFASLVAEVTLAGVEIADTTQKGVSVSSVEVVDASNVTISEAEESAFDVFESDSVTLLDITSTRSTPGAGVDPGQVSVRTAVTADLDGITVTGAGGTSGVLVSGTPDVTIDDSTISGSGVGLAIEDVGDVAVMSLAAENNLGDGVSVDGLYGTATFDDVAVTDNVGGGIVVDGTSAVAPAGETLVGDLVVQNSAVTGNDGGGISVVDAGNVTLSVLEVADNGDEAATTFGGLSFGLDADPSEVSISEATISGNVGDDGGGLTTSNHDGTIVIERSTFSGNAGDTADAIVVRSIAGDGQIQVVESAIIDHAGGPATFYDDGTSLRLESSTVAGNAATALMQATGGQGISVRNSTVTENTVVDALFTNGSFSFIDVSESTVAGNTITAASGGAFDRTVDGGQLIATNSIITANGTPLAAPGSVAPAPVASYSLLPVGTPAGGTGNVLSDTPQLGALTDNGGPTLTMLPSPTAPGVDLGDPAGAASAVTMDQRGLDRVVEGRIDIGAVERQRSPFVVGLPPARVLETRIGSGNETIDGLFEGIGRRAAAEELTLPIADRADVPPDAKAVVINVTAVRPGGPGFVTVHPCLLNPPLASSLNFRPEVDSGNEVIAQLNEDGELCLFNSADTDLVVDVVGYVPAESRYLPVGPARLLDTREIGFTIDGLFQKTGIRGSDTELELDVAGRAGVSEDAVAVVVNITGVRPVAPGHVTVHPCLAEKPITASLNFVPGINRGNEVVAQLDDEGKICLYTFGSAHLVVDVVGQLSNENVYTPVDPARIVETRPLPFGSIDGVQQGIGQLAAGQVLTVDAAGRAEVPDGAAGVVANVTAVRPEARGFITVWDCTGTMPLAASLNYIADDVVGNELVIDLGATGDFCLFTLEPTDVTIDVVGYLD